MLGLKLNHVSKKSYGWSNLSHWGNRLDILKNRIGIHSTILEWCLWTYSKCIKLCMGCRITTFLVQPSYVLNYNKTHLKIGSCVSINVDEMFYVNSSNITAYYTTHTDQMQFRTGPTGPTGPTTQGASGLSMDPNTARKPLATPEITL